MNLRDYAEQVVEAHQSYMLVDAIDKEIQSGGNGITVGTNRKLQAVIAALGFASEVFELLQVLRLAELRREAVGNNGIVVSMSRSDAIDKVVDEMGDVCWYLASLLNVLGIDAGAIVVGDVDKQRVEVMLYGKPSVEAFARAIPGAVADITEHVKKYTNHGKRLDRQFIVGRAKVMLALFERILRYLNFFGRTDYTIEDVLALNAKKLEKRHGKHGFNGSYAGETGVGDGNKQGEVEE